jgi:Bacterial Ig domain/Dockerin type I domain
MSLSAPVQRICLGVVTIVFFLSAVIVLPQPSWARNIQQYKDTISVSAPDMASNHTLSFVVDVTVPAEGYIEVIPPDGFTVSGSSTFSELRNVEMYINGSRRDVGPVLSATDDTVVITPGSPGAVRYNLNTTAGIPAGSTVELRIGNHTTLTERGSESFSTSTGTTTVERDVEPIMNSVTIGTHTLDVRVYDNTAIEIANAGFLIALVERVGVGPVDTTEEVPPVRTNGQPTGQLSGTTVGVEITVDTDEFSICRYSLTPGVDFYSMVDLFDNTGLIFHSTVVTVVPDSVNYYYVRCIDDEGNYNIDDYEIVFTVNARPTGTSNTDGDVSGDGSGSGNDGTGTGDNSGGTSGGGSGTAPSEGSSGGSGGSGGGGGGGSGGGSGSSGGGGFESTDGPYRSGDGEVIITGLAAPRAKMTVLVDGDIAKTATADNNGQYTVTIDAIAKGAYTFGIYFTDATGAKSSTFSTSFTVTGARSSALSNINIPPSVVATPNPVNPGQALTISGYTLPNATVTLENEKEKSASSKKAFTATAGSNGAWSIAVDTAAFSTGTYRARAKATQGVIFTNFSQYTLYGVGTTAKVGSSNSDLNTDGKVNLTDFSILLFWWNSAGSDSNPPADISQDGKVNLTDFSILLFNWTG